MSFVERLFDFLPLGGIHVRADSTVAKSDIHIFDASAEVNPNPQLRSFVAREPQRLFHPADHLAKSFLVYLPGDTEQLVDLVVRLHQQIGQQFFALNSELGEPKTNVQQIIVIQLDQFFLLLADRSCFHDR